MLPNSRVKPTLRITFAVAFVMACAVIYRLRGGGFGVNDWKPLPVHSRFIAWIPQTLLYILASRWSGRRSGSSGLMLGLLWLFAVLPGWGAWFDVGTYRGTPQDGYEIKWIDNLLDFGFGPLGNYLGQPREAWRDAAGLGLRGIYFWPLIFSAAWKCKWSVQWDRALLWCALWTILYPLCYAVGHRWWIVGPSPEFYVGFILGLATLPASNCLVGGCRN